jgi:hypothetical protein
MPMSASMIANMILATRALKSLPARQRPADTPIEAAEELLRLDRRDRAG